MDAWAWDLHLDQLFQKKLPVFQRDIPGSCYLSLVARFNWQGFNDDNLLLLLVLNICLLAENLIPDFSCGGFCFILPSQSLNARVRLSKLPSMFNPFPRCLSRLTLSRMSNWPSFRVRPSSLTLEASKKK